eukprot:jgi/Undpi1/7272/HiC_scaffold_22.g09745.m1
MDDFATAVGQAVNTEPNRASGRGRDAPKAPGFCGRGTGSSSTPAPAASPAIPGEGSTAATDSAKITRGKDPVATADVSGKGGTSVGDKPQAAGAVGVGGATATPVQDKGAGAAVELDKPWIVGRVLDEVDRRLGAKQEKIRKIEVGVIERYGSIISTLDGGLDVREGDDFLSWLRSQGFPEPAKSPSQAGEGTYHLLGEDGGEKEGAGGDDSSSSERNPGRGGGGDGGWGQVRGGGWGGGVEGAKKRADVETFLVAAAARLNALVAEQEEALFADRGEGAKKGKEVEGDGGGAGRAEKVAAESTTGDGSVEDGEAGSLNMPAEELHQARLAAHRAMLCHCLSLVSSSLGKQQLKSGLSLEEVAVATRSAYLAAPNKRLEAIFPLFDKHGDGHLDPESLELAMDAVILPVTVTTQRCYVAAARPALDKKAAIAMPKTMKYTLWDVLEVPVKRRCAFEWAEDRKRIGPDEFRVSWEQFEPSRRKHFPEFESVASMYLEEYGRRRSAWHNSRKARKEAAVYGSVLFFSVIVADKCLSLV